MGIAEEATVKALFARKLAVFPWRLWLQLYRLVLGALRNRLLKLHLWRGHRAAMERPWRGSPKQELCC